MKEHWVYFFLYSERFSGIVPTRADWNEIVDRHKDDGGREFLKRARLFSTPFSKRGAEIPRFGFSWEYRGSLTLGEWAEKNGMQL